MVLIQNQILFFQSVRNLFVFVRVINSHALCFLLMRVFLCCETKQSDIAMCAKTAVKWFVAPFALVCTCTLFWITFCIYFCVASYFDLKVSETLSSKFDLSFLLVWSLSFHLGEAQPIHINIQWVVRYLICVLFNFRSSLVSLETSEFSFVYFFPNISAVCSLLILPKHFY